MSDNWEKHIQERLNMEGRQNHVDVLKTEIELLASRIEEHDTGHLHTTIYTLKHRIEELEKELNGETEETSLT
tara:strand:+ start:1430 stop:1648 length:219 start_codon:yes stop_codon:yes gene_type:complete